MFYKGAAVPGLLCECVCVCVGGLGEGGGEDGGWRHMYLSVYVWTVSCDFVHCYVSESRHLHMIIHNEHSQGSR